jgi:polysaccharide export outer membrane protein
MPSELPIMRLLRLLLLTIPFCVPVPAAAQTGDGVASLQPGDLVRIRIWREPDLSGDFPVLEDGSVILPRLGPWPVEGKDPTALRVELTEEFQKNLRNPSIEIIILRRINIFGEVRQPGLYPVDPTMTLTEAIGLAGGPLSSADRQKIILMRSGREIEIELDQPYSVVDLDLRSGDQIYVPQRGWLLRNWPLVTSVISVTMSIALFLTRR